MTPRPTKQYQKPVLKLSVYYADFYSAQNISMWGPPWSQPWSKAGTLSHQIVRDRKVILDYLDRR